MASLWLLTIKNLRLLVRAKGSALIVIFAPLLIILLLGLSFNTSSQFSLNIGVHAPEFSDDVESFITLLEEEEFTITRYADSIDDCVNHIKSNTVNTCVELPSSFAIEENSPKEIVFHVDPSRVNIVGSIQDTVQKKFNIKAQEISEELTGNIVTQLVDTKNTIAEKQADITAAKEQAAAATDATSSSQTTLASVDTSTSGEDYNTSVVDNIDEDVEEAQGLIDTVIGSINAAVDDKEQQKEIKDLLNDANSKLDGVLDTLSGNGTDSVGSLIGSLKEDLTQTREKLSAASAAIGTTNENLDAVNAALAETSGHLSAVEAALQTIQANLESQKVTDSSTISAPLISRVETVSEESTYLNYLFPAILILVVMFSSLLLGTTLVLMERHSPAFLRNFFVPVRKVTFITSVYLTNIILTLIQLAVILGISLFFLQDSLAQFPAIALILFITSSVFIFFGMAVGYIFSSEETGILASISLGSIHLFLSGVILPLEGIAPFVQDIVKFNPFVIAETLIREVFIFKASLVDVWVNLSYLLGYAVVLFVIILIIESVMHKHLMEKFLRHHHRKHRQKDKKRKRNEA